jgi:ubiquinone/menaquinone biosynthesis C-methylase UbiE
MGSVLRATTENKTGGIYGELFTSYSQKQFDDSVALFEKRHRMWGIPLEFFRGKVCLDAGCGGGRFSIALAKLSAKKVVGIDVSNKALEAARQRALSRGLDNVEFMQGSALALPFGDSTFDYVISSGVIHHTPDPKSAFRELVRVLQPGGTLFLSVYGKYGLKWFVNDLFRYTLCKLIPFKAAEKLFAMVGVPANKRYNTLDNLYVDYAARFTETEIRRWLTDAGFENIRRVKFERYDYSTLRSRIIHGVGWIQMYADKKNM